MNRILKFHLNVLFKLLLKLRGKRLIKVSLERDQRVEVFYASDSLEKRIQNVSKGSLTSYKERIRFIRMPLLSSFPLSLGKGQSFFQLVTAKKLFLCRYDFYPELLLYGAREGIDFVLIYFWRSID